MFSPKPFEGLQPFLASFFIGGQYKNIMNLMEHKQEVYFANVLKRKRICTSSEDLFVAFI